MTAKSLLHSARITMWTLVALTSCAALVVLFTTISLDIRKKMSQTLRSLGANVVVSELSNSAEHDPVWKAVEEAARKANADIVVLTLRVVEVAGSPVAMVAAAPAGLSRMTSYWALSGRRAETRGECVVGKKAATRFDLSPGVPLSVVSPGTGASVELSVVGVFESGDEDEERIFVSGFQEPTAATPGMTYALLSVPGGERGIESLAEELEIRRAGVVMRPLRQILHGENAVLGKITLLSGLTLAVVLLLTASGVTATVLSRVVERRGELALLQALGANGRSVKRLLLAESAAVGLVSATLGFGLGTLLARSVVQQIFSVSITPRGTAFIAGLAVSLGVALLSGIAAARRTLASEPSVALRGE